MTSVKIKTAPRPLAGAGMFASLLAFLLPFMSLTVKGGVHIAQLLVLVAALWLLNKGLPAFYIGRARAIRWIVVGFAGWFGVSLLRLLAFDKSMHMLDGPVRLVLALAAIGVVGCLRPNVRWLWLGLCFGAIGAAAIALVERLGFGIVRAEGFTHHPITFGDLAVAMGVMSLCALSHLRGTRLAWLPVAALLAGVLAAVLSGSRGAWLGLLLGLVPLLRFGGRMHGRALWHGAGLVLLACLAAYAIPQTGVANRTADAVREVNQYVAVENAGTNVGVRLELWKASLMMIAEHPWAGVGRDAFHPTLLALERQGRLRHSVALDYSSSHNDVLHTLATGGVLDFSFLVVMYAGPLLFFWKVMKRGDDEYAPIGLAGVALVVCFIGFGLTDVMFWLMIPKVFYANMVCVLAGLCLTMPAGARSVSDMPVPATSSTVSR